MAAARKVNVARSTIRSPMRTGLPERPAPTAQARLLAPRGLRVIAVRLGLKVIAVRRGLKVIAVRRGLRVRLAGSAGLAGIAGLALRAVTSAQAKDYRLGPRQGIAWQCRVQSSPPQPQSPFLLPQ